MAIFPNAIATDGDLHVAVNNLSTLLTDNPLSVGATTVNVVATAGFPSTGFISIDAEIISYTGKTATSFTGCVRGSDGTTAASHAVNAQVDHNVIAAHHNTLKEEVKAIETSLFPLKNVKDYGAIGDGTTDDTAAINSAITTVAAANGVLYFPAGTYKITARLVLQSNIRIVGAGKYTTTITLPQSNIVTYDFSMFESTGNISNISFESIGLRGNYPFQTSGVVSGSQDGWGILLNAGSVTNLVVRDCYIREFGILTDVGQGGGISLIPDIGVANSTLDNINILDNHFGLIHGVPGVYVAPYYGTTGKGIGCNISRNRFDGGGVQNCVYVLGKTANPAYNVNVDSNEFVLLANIDFCVEFNGVFGGSISHNMMRSTSTGFGGGILIRGDATNSITTKYIVIDGNTLINENTGNQDGISLVSFDATGKQDHVIISNNVLVDYGRGTGKAAIQAGTGSRNVSIVGNQITSTAGSPLNRGITVADFSDLLIKDNLIKNTDLPIAVGGAGQLRYLTITDNQFNTCGTSGGTLIAGIGGTLDAAYMTLARNAAYASIAGTISLVEITTSSVTENYLLENILDVPDTLTPANWTTRVTSAQYGYLSGASSNLQTQLNGKASTALSNLASVAVNTTIVSDTDNTDDLGTSSINWRNLYLKGDVLVGSTIAVDLASSGAVSIRGTDTNDDASTGFVGQLINSNVARSGPVATVASTAKTVTSISLTAGDWDVTGAIGFRTTATTTVFVGAINTTTDALPTGDAYANFSGGLGAISHEGVSVTSAKDWGIALPSSRVKLSSTTTIYLVAYSDQANNVFGYIEARRIR